MRSFLRSVSVASLAIGGVVWLVSAPTVGCGGSTAGLADPEINAAGVDGGDTGEEPEAVCGNGKQEGLEACDDGNATNGDGCENDCTKTCLPGPVGDKFCDDGNACNGVETCGADNKCTVGKPLVEGDACGTGKLCKAGLCIDASCGDGVVSGAEECDDGNVTDGDGCDMCKHSCVSTDPTRDCSGGDPCAGASTCDDATHTCAPGTPLADGTSCGTGKICKAATCVSASCGDGVVTAPEECDLGAGNGPGTGCEVDCKLSCANDAACGDGNPCNGAETCQAVTVDGKSGKKCAAGTPLADGTSCGSGKTCKAGACAAPTCGNGTIDPGEDCDFGAGNGAGTGCETSCKFSCTKSPDSCSDGNACNGVETCQTVTVSGKTGQKCSSGTPLAACAACGSGGVCVAGSCATSICGDGCVDATKGEQCEPKSTATCDASCKTIVPAVCGNGIRETGETCDDSGKVNLDGCDATCGFEQSQRANSVKMQRVTDSAGFCTINALGGALSSTALGQLQTSLDEGVQDGSISILFKFLGLDDLSGTADPSLSLGNLTGTPAAAPAGVTYDGRNALDWWYTADAPGIDASRNPLASLSASIVSKTLDGGPGNMTLVLSLTGGPTPLKLSSVRVRSSIGATSKPLSSTGATPGHLPSEHLDPALTSFATMTNGKLCGNVSAASLAKVPAPEAIVSGLFSCSQGYTASNSMLDILIGGCDIIFVGNQVKKTDPDQVDPTAPAVGAGGPYKLTASTSTKKVTGCTDKTGASVDLAKCLDAAAYSSYFTFTTQRVIIK